MIRLECGEEVLGCALEGVSIVPGAFRIEQLVGAAGNTARCAQAEEAIRRAQIGVEGPVVDRVDDRAGVRQRDAAPTPYGPPVQPVLTSQAPLVLKAFGK